MHCGHQSQQNKYLYIYINQPYELINLHMPSRSLYHYKIVIDTLAGHACKKGGISTMADSFITPRRSVFSRPSLQFLEALLLREAGQTPMLTGQHSEYLPGWISFL